MHMRQTQSGKFRLDNTDIQILKILLTDGRISIRELSKRVYLSSKNVQARVNDLIRAGIIAGFSAVIDREKLEEE
jgi:Lrp/AsnC family leucine-responsive transcriptional regulator